MQRWLASRGHHSTSITYLPVKNCDGGCLQKYPGSPRLTFFAAITLILGLLTLVINIYQLHAIHQGGGVIRASIQVPVPVVEANDVQHGANKPMVWVRGRKLETGYLEHVYKVFDRLGYRFGSETTWDVLWSHDYPFAELPTVTRNLLPHQKVNHFPGSGFITNKVSLATSNLSYVPMAFRMPDDKELLMEHASAHPAKMFVQKNNKHRGIKVEKVAALNLTADGSFVQEYIHNPFLIDGKKFDVGIYTILTSIDPLRVYTYNGDALLRFCLHDYNPFDHNDLDKYVVGDDYLPTWEIPSLKMYYSDLGYTMKESLNAYIRSTGKDPSKIWTGIDEAIKGVFMATEGKLVAASSKYKSARNFFEMMRFDFVVDEDLNVYIMEANMSPNLSSAHFSPNRLLYEQVIFNLLSTVGLSSVVDPDSIHANSDDARDMQVSDKDLTVLADTCAQELCKTSCGHQQCKLCHHCMGKDWNSILKSAYKEHLHRLNCRRIIPGQMSSKRNLLTFDSLRHLSEANRLMHMWFQGKCIQDETWCR